MARTLIAAQAVLGECALWCEREQALFWTDIDSARLSRWCAADGDSSSAVQQWAMPERLGSFALCERPGRLLGEPTPFARLAADDGEPDGATVDADGGLWVALWGAACVVRFDAGGRETLRLPVPASQPTCPTFGGGALDRLFLTSARRDITDEARAGDVSELPATGYRGLPAHRFCTP